MRFGTTVRNMDEILKDTFVIPEEIREYILRDGGTYKNKNPKQSDKYAVTKVAKRIENLLKKKVINVKVNKFNQVLLNLQDVMRHEDIIAGD
jgi:hypothetical protein